MTLRQAPVAHVVLDLPDQRGVGGVPGPAPHPDRDPVPGDGHPDHDLGQVVAVVLGLAPGAEPGLLAVFRIMPAGDGAAVLVAGDGLVGLFRLEVGGGRIEEQQVNFKVQQVRDLVEDLPFQLVSDLQQPVHRPVARIVRRGGQAGDQDVLADPAGGGQLGRRCQRPVRDQGEQHPLGCVIQAAALQQLAHRRADAQL